MQRLILRVITGLVAFIIGLATAWAISFGVSPTSNTTSDFNTQEQHYRSSSDTEKSSGCLNRKR